jgi:hypothetical protein
MPTAQPQSPEGLKWLPIDNFTPGIWSQPTGSSAGVGPGPVGAAQDSGATYACYATPTGALTPLPGRIAQIPLTDDSILPKYIVGFFVVSPISDPTKGVGDELIVGFETSNGSSVAFYVYSYLNNTSILLVHLTASGDLPYTALTGGFTAANPTTPTIIGLPLLAMMWAVGSTVWMALWPDPTAPTSTTPYQFASPPPLGGSLHVHQSRIVVFEQQNHDAGSTQNFPNNDAISYTDPPNSLSTFTSGGTLQRSVFVQENPQGIGAWGSFSAGELMLIKKLGGGAIISGDLNFPTVTYIPGVQPTLGASSVPSFTQMGLTYHSAGAGVWAWSGNSTSQKLSASLNDSTFENIVGVPPGASFFQAFQWGQFVMCSGDLVYDTQAGGWWRLAPPNPGPTTHVFYGSSVFDASLYAANGFVSSAYPYLADQYSLLSPAGTYSWQSVPLPAAIDKTILVRRVALRAQGSGSVQVTISSSDGVSTQTKTLHFTDVAHPVIQDATFGVQSTDIVVTLLATASSGGLPAPTIFSCSLGYEGDIRFTNPM